MQDKRGMMLRQVIDTILWHIVLDTPGGKQNKFTIKSLTYKGGKTVSRHTYYRVLKSLCEVGILEQEEKSYFLKDDYRNEMINKITNWMKIRDL